MQVAWSNKKLCTLSNLDNVTNYLFIILYHVQHQFIVNAPLIRMKVPEQNPIDDEHAPANQDDRDEHAPSDQDDRDEHAPADQDDRDYDSDNTKDPELIFFLIIISVAQI